MSGGFDRRALARAISAIENGEAAADDLLRAAYAAGRHALVIGVTGPPGAGKSTLIDRLAAHWASRGERVALLTVDPSSPFSGGALLGDRIRMEQSSADPTIYQRSLSARGHLGGASAATADILVLLSAEGFGRVILETVGAGQSDIEVAGLADAVLVVCAPGLGDQIQASKAGLMEIGDVYAVNKSDRPGAAQARGYLKAMLDTCYMGAAGVNPGAVRTFPTAIALSPGVQRLNERHGDPAGSRSSWRPPVLATTAADGSGVSDVAEALDGFVAWLDDTNRVAARRQLRVRDQLVRLAMAHVSAALQGMGGELATASGRVGAGAVGPSKAIDALVLQLAAMLAAHGRAAQ